MPNQDTFFSKQPKWEITRIVIVGIVCLLYYFKLVPLGVLLSAIAFGLYALVKAAVISLIKERKIGTELFITIAVVISILGKEYLAGAVVLMIILIAEYIATASAEKARASIKALIGSTPQTAIVKRKDREEQVKVEDLCIGDVVVVKCGEKIPVDGEVLKGAGAVNEAPITGESVPREKDVTDQVYAGTILETGALDVEMTKAGKDTVFARIVSLVEEAEAHRAPIERFTDKIASWLIPIVFVFVGVVYFYTRDTKLIVALLIFTSPAELGLATPLVTIAAIARAAREGILIKGGLYLEELAKVNTIVFDKTGTLTVGEPTVSEVKVTDRNMSLHDIVVLAASADNRSSHPLAKAILQYAKTQNAAVMEPEQFEVIKGRGVRAVIDGKTVLFGNRVFMTESHITGLTDESVGALTALYLAVGTGLAAVFYMRDEIRSGGRQMVDELRRIGIKDVWVLTGDNRQTAEYVAGELGISNYKYDLLPEDKISFIRELQDQKGVRVAMVGDGVNDAPALVQANVGIAMGAIGTQAAMEAADIVLMEDKLEKIARIKAISKRAYRTVKENIIVGVGVVHITGIVLVLMRVIDPVTAAVIHLVPDTLVFLNSIKLLRAKI